MVATYNKAIKVTVDGPREPRSKTSKYLVSRYVLKIKGKIRSSTFDVPLKFPFDTSVVKILSKHTQHLADAP